MLYSKELGGQKWRRVVNTGLELLVMEKCILEEGRYRRALLIGISAGLTLGPHDVYIH